jgi:hypothetical protein
MTKLLKTEVMRAEKWASFLSIKKKRFVIFLKSRLSLNRTKKEVVLKFV